MLYNPIIQLARGSAGSTLILEIVLDDFHSIEDAVESFVLQLLHNADILPPNVVLGTTVISIMNVGECSLLASCYSGHFVVVNVLCVLSVCLFWHQKGHL